MPKGPAAGSRRTSMGTTPCGRRPHNRVSSSARCRQGRETSSRLSPLFSRLMSRAIEDRRQSAPMLAFALEGATYHCEGLSERKDVRGDEQIGVLGSYWMPVDTLRCYGDLRHQIGACKCDALRGETPQCNAPDHPVLLADPLGIEEATELLGLVISGDGRCQSHPEPFRASAFNTLPRAHPCALSAMAVVPLGRRTVEADLQRQAIAWQ